MSAPTNNLTPTNTQLCNGCRQHRPLNWFEGRTRAYRSCHQCRNRQTPILRPPEHLLRLSEISHEFLETDQRGEDGVCLNADILLDDGLRLLSDEQIKVFLLDKVQLLDGYEYFWKHAGTPQLRFGVAFEAVCSQDREGNV